MTIKRQFACLGTGLVFALAAGLPALGDDTELLLSSSSTGAAPNILFILDSSGSMNTLESTIEPYESTNSYGGGTCDAGTLYWSNNGLVPTCDAGNTRYIPEASFVCATASLQLAGLGSYSGTLAQYRTEGAGGYKWRAIAPGENVAIVECEEDSGLHGDGAPGLVYAKAGTDDVEFSSNPAEEVDWRSFPTDQPYTMYDGNYLNWRAAPPVADIKRIDIVKIVLNKVLSAYKDVNIGLMRFNENDGGPVVQAIKDLDSSRAELAAKLAIIDGGGNTPLSETFYEAALYWQGLDADYGERISEYITDPAALDTINPANYAAPPDIGGTCPRNFNILLSDGLPKNDEEGETKAPTLPGFEAALGRTACIYTDEGDCLDDIAEYLYKHDVSPDPGVQVVQTYSVSFLAPVETMDLMKSAAEVTDGKFFLADDPESLAVSLLSIFNEIVEQTLTFAAPAVAVNAFNRTQNLNDLYMTVFTAQANVHWPGNLKKYSIFGGEIVDSVGSPAVNSTTGFFNDTAKSYWTVGAADGADVLLGGAANLLPDPASRNLYTYNGSDDNLNGASNDLSSANLAAYSLADFAMTGAIGEPTIDEVLRWANGEDIRNEDGDASTTVRNVMGDPLHSQPAAVDYGKADGTPDIVVYSATNDGYLHAIDGDTGIELWSFIPKGQLPDLPRLLNNPGSKSKHYGLDGDVVPVINDRDGNGRIDGTDFVYIIFGMRRGGNNVFALDVTDKNAPKMLWNVSYAEFGQTWSAPVVAKVDTTAAGLGADKAVVILGAGYDTLHDAPAAPGSADVEGVGVLMLDLETGNKIWRAGTDAGADLQLATMTRSFPSRIKVIDINGDHFADRMYATDVGGQVWRFDIFSGEAPADLVHGGVIAQLGFEGIASPTAAETLRVYNSPDVSIFNDEIQERSYIALSIGTGYRAHPLDTGATDRFYSLRDPDVFNQLSQANFDTYNIADESDFKEVSGKTLVEILPADRGWKFTMPSNQMVLTDSTTFDNSVFFVGFSPQVELVAGCQTIVGHNFLYQMSIDNGDPVVNNLDTLDPADADDARRTDLAQGGIAPTPALLFPSPDDPSCTGSDCAPPPIACVGVECFDPGFENDPVRTHWTQDGIE